MLTTKRKPVTVGEILITEFLEPLGVTPDILADAMGMPHLDVDLLCRDQQPLTAATALILARIFGTSPDFWLNIQRRSDLWAALNDPTERARIERARPLIDAA